MFYFRPASASTVHGFVHLRVDMFVQFSTLSPVAMVTLRLCGEYECETLIKCLSCLFFSMRPSVYVRGNRTISPPTPYTRTTNGRFPSVSQDYSWFDTPSLPCLSAKIFLGAFPSLWLYYCPPAYISYINQQLPSLPNQMYYLFLNMFRLRLLQASRNRTWLWFI